MSTSRAEGYRKQYQLAHEWLESTVDGMTNEQANFQPPGTAMSAGAHYMHHVQGEDGIFNGMLGGNAPLMAGEFASKMGSERASAFGGLGGMGAIDPDHYGRCAGLCGGGVWRD